jgi:PhzF family phenazine biosynthesis protein
MAIISSDMKRIPILQIDAFASRPFVGNPAAVCLLENSRDASWMQSVAAEMNLSETAYVVPRADGFDLRWFTPAVEVALCGHATLASAHALWSTGRAPEAGAIRFHTLSGVLSCTRRDDRIEMDFPATPAEPAPAPRELCNALGASPVLVGRYAQDYLVVVKEAAEVRALAPDFALLRRLPVRGIAVTAPSDDPAFDFVSRFFAPGAGIDEDPVTGAAHCCLGPYWSECLGRAKLRAFQASARGGTVDITVSGDRVMLAGQAVTVLEGHLLDP